MLYILVVLLIIAILVTVIKGVLNLVYLGIMMSLEFEWIC